MVRIDVGSKGLAIFGLAEFARLAEFASLIFCHPNSTEFARLAGFARLLSSNLGFCRSII